MISAERDALLQRGLRERNWDAVIEQLRKGEDTSSADPAKATLEQLRAEVRELVQNLSDAASVGDVNRIGTTLNQRIEMMKGLESAMSDRSLAIAGTV